MTRSMWGALALTLALAGCNQPAPEGDQTTTTTTTTTEQAAENQAQARGQLANAFVEAARVHAMVARNDAGGATTAVRQLRDELASAKSGAPLDVQSRINELDQLAIETQQAIATNTPEALQTSSRLVDEMQVALGGAPAELSPSGGGAGSALDMRERRDALPPNAPAGSQAVPNQPAPNASAPGEMDGPAGAVDQPAPGTRPGTGAPVNTAP